MIQLSKSKISVFDTVMTVVFTIICFLTLYPFIYALSYSLSDGLAAQKKPVVLLPRGFSLQNYQAIFSDNRMLTATFVSISRTLLGIVLFIVVTGLCAYAMSRPGLKFKKVFFVFFVIPMYFNGGMIPSYLNVHDLGLMNNFLVYILPGCYATFYMFLMRSYIDTIPYSLVESAWLDGAGETTILTKIYLPLTKPVIATVALFVGVAQWNSWYDAMLYIVNKNLYPLQMVLQSILQQAQQTSSAKLFLMGLQNSKVTLTAETYTMAVLIVTTLPIVFIYPFAQRYFIKGMTIGAVKL